MKKDEKPMEWGDFTNKVLGIIGKFVLIPLILIGSAFVFISPVIGLAIIFGSAFLFVGATLMLVIFKPVLIKKYPEPKKPEKPANFEQMSREERKKLPFQSSGEYMVDPAEPYEEMNKLHKFAVDRFGGDLQLALDYIFTNLGAEEQNSFIDNLSETDIAAARNLVFAKAKQRLTDKEIKGIVNDSVALSYLGMEEEDVLKAKKNPFVKKMFISIGALLISVVVVAVLLVLAEEYIVDDEWAQPVAAIIGCGSTFFVFKTVKDIMNCIRFKRLKRKLEKEKKDEN